MAKNPRVFLDITIGGQPVTFSFTSVVLLFCCFEGNPKFCVEFYQESLTQQVVLILVCF
jgi:hypothetical protein